MSNVETFFPRRLLTLEALRLEDEDDEVFEVISNLKSPLGLALILIDAIFTDNGEHLKAYSETLDETKKVAFGLGSAEKLFLESSDKLAMYSLYQFAFQQFVQSSFRARQGKALEEILKKILTVEEMRITPQIAFSRKEKIEILKVALNNSKNKAKSLLDKHDVDILAETEDKIIIFQMRSRDDTGGATAKPSLAELLRDLKREELSKEILYLIYTWVKPKSGEPPQKVTLINKLTSMIDLENEEEIKEILKQGKVAKIKDNLKVCVVYGAEELIKTLWSEFGITIDEKYEELMKRYKRYLELLSSWDDLWLSYAVATLELENLVKHGKTNVAILSQKLYDTGLEEKLKSEKCLLSYEQCSAEITKDISPLIRGDDDLIPFNAVGDKMNYIRDLILLRVVYEHLEEIIQKICVDDSTRKKIRKLQKTSKENNKGQIDIAKFLKKKR